jgi:hypothetical protein
MSESEAKELVELLRTCPCVSMDDRVFFLSRIPSRGDKAERARNLLETLRNSRDKFDEIDEGLYAKLYSRNPVAVFIGSIPNPA